MTICPPKLTPRPSSTWAVRNFSDIVAKTALMSWEMLKRKQKALSNYTIIFLSFCYFTWLWPWSGHYLIRFIWLVFSIPYFPLFETFFKLASSTLCVLLISTFADNCCAILHLATLWSPYFGIFFHGSWGTTRNFIFKS